MILTFYVDLFSLPLFILTSLDALASLRPMMESGWVINVFEIASI